MSARAPATLKKSFDADISSQHEYHLPGIDLRRGFYRGRPGLGLDAAAALALHHLRRSRETAAGSVQSSAPRHGTWDRLPLLPYLGRAIRLRGNSTDKDVYELPFADMDQRADARAGARQLPQRPVIAV